MIIAGYTSYPWDARLGTLSARLPMPGACLLADISHIAGMVAAGVVPCSSTATAHVISFTTHKTLYGLRARYPDDR